MKQSLLEEWPVYAAQFAPPRRVLVISDYDGTLTEIVGRPEQATLSAERHALLERLASSPRVTLALVSGRSLEDLQTLTALNHVIYAGNHGMEIKGPGREFVEPQAAAAAPALAHLCQQVEAAAGSIPGFFVENKRLTASMHFRQVAEERRGEVERAVRALVPPDHPEFLLRRGRAVYEIRPRVSWHKGDAAEWIRDQWAAGVDEKATLVLGDDRTDDDMFKRLSGAATVEVDGHAESAARFGLESPAEVYELLARLLQ